MDSVQPTEIAEAETDHLRGRILSIDDIPKAFDTKAYLKEFYSGVIDEPAMHMVLHYLPNIAARLPYVEHFLDFGCGPTVHSAMCFRNKVSDIYFADFLPQNRQELQNWLRRESSFDWTRVTKLIAMHEGCFEEWPTMQESTRHKIKSTLHCDMLKSNPLDNPKYKEFFDIITSFYCTEYSVRNAAEYKQAIENICSLLKPGGFLIMGGVLEETWCGFGGLQFESLYLTEKLLFDALATAKINTQNSLDYYVNDGIFLLCGRKCNYSPIF